VAVDKLKLDVTGLRMVPVVAEIEGVEKAKTLLEEHEGERDFDTLWRIYVEDSPPVADEGFVRRHGWFARLALSHGLPDDHPTRRALLRDANQTFLGISIATFGALAAILAGIVLLPVGLSLLARGHIGFAYEPPPRTPSDIVWLQTTVLLLAGVIVAALVGGWSMWALVLVPLWPLARGVGGAEWRAGLGLSRGRGIVREAFAGFVGYLAGIPVFAAGFLATVYLARVIGEPVSHPAIGEAGDPSARLHLFLATCLWAPLVEEAVFRGAFQSYLRPRMSRLLAAAVTGLVFAFVHPQGLAAIPALMSIGGWFALLREWRGTLIPSLVAHAMHNAALVSLTVFVVY
jgi:membrane protease YdiL (CAAX protease family)